MPPLDTGIISNALVWACPNRLTFVMPAIFSLAYSAAGITQSKNSPDFTKANSLGQFFRQIARKQAHRTSKSSTDQMAYIVSVESSGQKPLRSRKPPSLARPRLKARRLGINCPCWAPVALSGRAIPIRCDARLGPKILGDPHDRVFVTSLAIEYSIFNRCILQVAGCAISIPITTTHAMFTMSLTGNIGPFQGSSDKILLI